MILTKKHPKRYAIFVFYDGEGIVDDYSTYFLRELQKVTDRILCIVNGKVTEEGIKKLQACSSEVLVRENKGLDITAYNLGLFRDGYDTLCSYDEAIVCNATVFGPFYPFSEMFDSMAKRDLDFWGISAFHGTCQKDPGSAGHQGRHPRYQSASGRTVRRSLLDQDGTSCGDCRAASGRTCSG